MISLIIAVILASFGQMILKFEMLKIGALDFGVNKILDILITFATKPLIILGLGLYGLSSFFYLVGLSKIDLSVAYPIAALSFVIVVIGSWLIFSEPLNAWRLLGLALIILGVVLLARTT
jgi:multidrug transporter EmrE-like cation transporter